jgi:predicted lipoprotein with Yx(FWY)xxD motif
MTSRRSTAQALVGAAALLALTAAACGGSGTSGTATDGSSGSASDPSPASGATAAGKVTTRDVADVGTVLVNGKAMTLYTNEAENAGKIRCVDSCTDFWPPVTAAKGHVPASVPGMSGAFSVVDRPDGTTQLALDGHPLYTFSEDRAPGSASGNGFSDDFQGTKFVWHAATPDGSTPKATAGDSAGNGGGGSTGGSGGYNYGY